MVIDLQPVSCHSPCQFITSGLFHCQVAAKDALFLIHLMYPADFQDQGSHAHIHTLKMLYDYEHEYVHTCVCERGQRKDHAFSLRATL